MGDALTSALDFIGVLLIATALFVLLGCGGLGLLVAGVFLLVCSFVASALSAARLKRSDE